MNLRIPINTGRKRSRNKDKLRLSENTSGSSPEGSEVEIDLNSCLLSVSSLGGPSESAHKGMLPSNQHYERCQQKQSVILSSEEGEEDLSLTCSEKSDKGTSGRSVSFGQIMVRHYNRTVTDHPSVSSGPAVGLDWGFSRTECDSIDMYEERRGRRRRSTELILRRFEREIILKKDCKIPQSSIARSIRKANSTKSRRRQTINNLKFSFFEEKWQNTTKNFKKMLGLRKSTKKQMELLWERARQEHNRDSQENDASTCAISRHTAPRDSSIRGHIVSRDNVDNVVHSRNRTSDALHLVEDNRLNSESEVESTHKSTETATLQNDVNRRQEKIHAQEDNENSMSSHVFGKEFLSHSSPSVASSNCDLSQSTQETPIGVKSGIRKVFKLARCRRQRTSSNSSELDERIMSSFDLDMPLHDSRPSKVCIEETPPVQSIQETPIGIKAGIRKVFKLARRQHISSNSSELDERSMSSFDLDMPIHNSRPSRVCIEGGSPRDIIP
jgi:hypothetical protein